jgi:hypothetical protein
MCFFPLAADQNYISHEEGQDHQAGRDDQGEGHGAGSTGWSVFL